VSHSGKLPRGRGHSARWDRFALFYVIRAVRRIRAGEELFLDYALVIDGDDPAGYPCACGTGACRGTMAASAAEPAVPV
jgi:hypothetical protein